MVLVPPESGPAMHMSSSLLTPNENHAFNAFLSSIDYASYPDAPDADPAATLPPEWAMYSSELGIGAAPHDVGVHVVPPVPQGKEALALAQATKNLMALGNTNIYQQQPQTWPSAAPVPQNPFMSQHQLGPSSGYGAPSMRTLQQQQQQQREYMSSPTTASPQVFHRNPSEPGPSFHAPSPHSAPKRSATEPNPAASKRRRSSAASPAYAVAHPPPPPPRSASSSKSASPPVAAPASDGAKPPLLSPSQKKANHIQSEQKRRANIRRGYEALCETVPALREAIRLMEAEQGAGVADGQEEAGKKGKKRRSKKVNDDGERVDGRAGPKSECVVLQKTIEYVHELLSEREELFARYHQARSALVPGHPALQPIRPLDANGMPGMPLWEREWTGGANDDDEGDSDEEDNP